MEAKIQNQEEEILYRVFETLQFQEDIKEIQWNFQKKLYFKIKNYIYPQLKNNPFYGSNIKKLKNWSPPTWRYRIGNYRLFYEIEDNEKIVFITALELRKNAYK